MPLTLNLWPPVVVAFSSVTDTTQLGCALTCKQQPTAMMMTRSACQQLLNMAIDNLSGGQMTITGHQVSSGCKLS
jgi:hypothetical protein